MSGFPRPLEQLIKQLSKLPGVGQRSAQRIAFYLISQDEERSKQLAEAVLEAKSGVKPCPVCGCYTESENDECRLCSDPSRKDDVICVVATARDAYSLDSVNEFKGRYHVLGGVLSPMDGVGPKDLRIAELLDRVKKCKVKEVIIALNPDIEGEATSRYLADAIKPYGARVTKLAYGIPIGGSLEFVDSMTLSLALEGRRDM